MGAHKKRLALQVSYRSSESDHNHIFLIYSYILYVVAAISHIRGIQRPLLSQSKRHRSQLKTHKTHNFMSHFNIIISYIADCTFFPDSLWRMSLFQPLRTATFHDSL